MSMSSELGAQTCVRIRKLRAEMTARGLDAWIVPTGDPHLCEYQPQDWAFRKYLSGFSGSAGTLAVSMSAAALWTDSRYWEQAAKELEGSGIDLMQDGLPETPTLAAALSCSLMPGAKVGLDPNMMSAKRFSLLKKALNEADIEVICDCTLVDAVWSDRPKFAAHPARAFEHGQRSAAEKLSMLRSELAHEGADAILLSSLEDIAWLVNLRGADLACTPVFRAYALVLPDRAFIYTNALADKPELVVQLSAAGFDVRGYELALSEAAGMLGSSTVLVDPAKTSQALFEKLEAAGIRTLLRRQPTELLKSRKTKQELSLLRETMRHDGAAMCELFCWLQEELQAGRRLTEMDVSMKLKELRSRRPGFMGLSFETIAAAGANAALPHYQPQKDSAAALERGELLLIDSGGQYEGGTTDITRTIAIGEPSAAMKRDFTAVLRGHILLASTHFPEGAFASQLDTLARMPLWEIGCDFGHGTGHGVGFCLGVHEGPVAISPRSPAEDASRVLSGLVVSNEPGLYRPGRWGVRIENLVTPVPTEPEIDQMIPMMVFETLTLCPIDTRLVNTAMMTPFEIWWLNDYHRRVREALSELVSEKALNWLKNATETI